MERHASHRAITIVKSSVAGFVVQPFTVKEGGVEAVEDSRDAASDDFAIHDELFSDLALAAVPAVDPACTLRSTQQSTAEDPDATQLVGQSDDESPPHRESAEDQVQDGVDETENSSFDIVSDSNSEEGDESFNWDVTEE
uniref:Uncharacterized protein n=2 Tax=Phytophthora ramorum TaxID=164328 RepID=H3GLA8_PHYRM